MYYYKQVVDGKIISVEAKSSDSASPVFERATCEEYTDFIIDMPPPGPAPETFQEEVRRRLRRLEDELPSPRSSS